MGGEGDPGEGGDDPVEGGDKGGGEAPGKFPSKTAASRSANDKAAQDAIASRSRAPVAVGKTSAVATSGYGVLPPFLSDARDENNDNDDPIYDAPDAPFRGFSDARLPDRADNNDDDDNDDDSDSGTEMQNVPHYQPMPADVMAAIHAANDQAEADADDAEESSDTQEARNCRTRCANNKCLCIGLPVGLAALAIAATCVAVFFDDIKAAFATPPTPPPPPVPGEDGGPTAVDDTLTGESPADTITIDVLKNDTPSKGGNAPDPVTVKLIEPDAASPAKKTIGDRGAFSVDATTGKITFTPTAKFSGGTVQAQYTVAAKTTGKRSNAAIVKITYDTAPVVFDHIVNAPAGTGNVLTIDVLKGNGTTTSTAAKKGTNAIDPARVAFTGLIRMAEVGPLPDAMVNSAATTLSVTGQGDWTTDGKGLVTFTPVAAFKGTPTAVGYQVGDSKGIGSNVGMIVFTPYLDQIKTAFAAMNKLTDAQFWTNYQAKVINADFGKNQTSITAKILYMRELHELLRVITSDSITNNATLTMVLAKVNTLTIPMAYAKWQAAGYDLQSLFNIAAVIDDAMTGLAATPNGTRLVRLTFITRQLNGWAKDTGN